MTHVIPLTGFLGAGKTTTVNALAEFAETRGRRVAVVTNDQDGDLIDSIVVANDGRSVAEVTGGCFCCRYDDLRQALEHVSDVSDPHYILAESVGSCTDLTATVVRPLQRDGGLGVGPLVAVVDPLRLLSLDSSTEATRYLFERQLRDADLLAVNKVDLLGTDEVIEIRELLDDVGVPVMFYSARTSEGIEDLWAAAVEAGPSKEFDLDIDYATYAAAEAELAWLNRRFTVHSARVVNATEWIDEFLRAVAGNARTRGHEIGHVKVVLRRGAEISKASLVDRVLAPQHDSIDLQDITAAVGLVNARVSCSPAAADALVERSMAAANEVLGSQTQLLHGGAAFAPPAPRPTHRMLVSR